MRAVQSQQSCGAQLPCYKHAQAWAGLLFSCFQSLEAIRLLSTDRPGASAMQHLQAQPARPQDDAPSAERKPLCAGGSAQIGLEKAAISPGPTEPKPEPLCQWAWGPEKQVLSGGCWHADEFQNLESTGLFTPAVWQRGKKEDPNHPFDSHGAVRVSPVQAARLRLAVVGHRVPLNAQASRRGSKPTHLPRSVLRAGHGNASLTFLLPPAPAT